MSPDVIRTRAIENLVFTITANRVGREMVDGALEEFRGGSRIVDPEGALLHEAGRAEALGLVDIIHTREEEGQPGLPRLPDGNPPRDRAPALTASRLADADRAVSHIPPTSRPFFA